MTASVPSTAENGLALNPDKSEVLVQGIERRVESVASAVTLGDTSIAVSKTVKSLGVALDETLFCNSQVDNVCKAAHFHIRALRHIRRCIDDETARTVACSMVGARFDYFNSIFYGNWKPWQDPKGDEHAGTGVLGCQET